MSRATATGAGGPAYRNSGSAGQLRAKVYTASGTTDATGNVTFNLPAGYFTTVHTATPTVVRNTNDHTLGTFATVRTAGAGQVVVQCFESKTSGVLLGGVIEGLEATATAGITVTLVVFGV